MASKIGQTLALLNERVKRAEKFNPAKADLVRGVRDKFLDQMELPKLSQVKTVEGVTGDLVLYQPDDYTIAEQQAKQFPVICDSCGRNNFYCGCAALN